MSNSDDATQKFHYICQTYVEKDAGRAGQVTLKIDKQFEYSNANDAQNRAEREAMRDDCAGADAYMLCEDLGTGEVEAPSFLVRLGNVPEFDEF